MRNGEEADDMQASCTEEDQAERAGRGTYGSRKSLGAEYGRASFFNQRICITSSLIPCKHVRYVDKTGRQAGRQVLV
jgi:hypothetical protein